MQSVLRTTRSRPCVAQAVHAACRPRAATCEAAVLACAVAPLVCSNALVPALDLSTAGSSAFPSRQHRQQRGRGAVPLKHVAAAACATCTAQRAACLQLCWTRCLSQHSTGRAASAAASRCSRAARAAPRPATIGSRQRFSLHGRRASTTQQNGLFSAPEMAV